MAFIPEFRVPPHPGKMLMDEFLRPRSMTEEQLSEAINIPLNQIQRVIAQKQGLSPEMAIRLSHHFAVSPNFWINLQTRWDLYSSQGSSQGVKTKSATSW
ncbi:HigA family addiction module antidote protein [Paraneptunicella aestuarii]|uniref:HigA family addiction module antitoxin n=1 Tax=Paraneptunicella aestuarii TaxID=2831148 RepID=UPI001E3A3329|nr:HigA family addiction module antitoxin [Paraneptunicella aestuarii]UAA39042.1 HigA family addiction module antidote protein [Paraneptunicella aestuarii]